MRRVWLSVAGVLVVLLVMKLGTAVFGLAGAVLGVLATIGVLWVTRAGHATWHDLGITRHSLRVGAAWSGGFFALFATGFALTALASRAIPVVGEWLQSLQVESVQPSREVYQALVAIPLGTVLIEEIAFRSALPALFGRAGASVRMAVIGSAVLFGLWHIAPSLNAAMSSVNASVPVWVTVLGTVVFTTASGIGLGWLRHRSGSILPPMVVHMTTNSLGVALLWFLAAT
jgi:uncharacterized protein